MEAFDKLDKFKSLALEAFLITDPEHALNVARKAAEAFCKVIILQFYGANRGRSIILGHERYDGTPVRKSNPNALSLNALSNIVTHEDSSDYLIIKDRAFRSRIKDDLATLRSRGNFASHDPNSTSQNISESDVLMMRLALSEIVTWLYEQYLKETIPSELISLIDILKKDSLKDIRASRVVSMPSLADRVTEEDIRGFDIVSICFPRLSVNSKSYKDSGLSVSYEYAWVEVAKGVVIGHLFLRKNSLIENTILHFFTHEDIDTERISSLRICSPKIKSRTTGEQLDRLASLKGKFDALTATFFSGEVEFFYIEEFVWKYCLGEHADLLLTPEHVEKFFIDQDIFRDVGREEAINLEASLEYLRKLIENIDIEDQENQPVNIILGKAGVGKSTFCYQLVDLVNSYSRKRAILITPSDLSRVDVSSRIETIADLYNLSTSGEVNSHEILEKNNLEINLSCGNIVLIIDSLDEIESNLKENFSLESFLLDAIRLNASYSKCLIIITVRDYYFDKYIGQNFVNIFRLLGFSEKLVDKYLDLREFTNSQKREVKKYLSIFDILEQDRYAPLYLRLTCELFSEQDEYFDESFDDISGSRYFYGSVKVDKIIFDLISREIRRQKLNISCDDYFEILSEIVVKNKGVVSREYLNEYLSCIHPSIPKKSGDENEYRQIYISPLLRGVDKNQFFRVRYDVIEQWIKIRSFIFDLNSYVFNNDVILFLSDLYDGESVFLKEIVELRGKLDIDILRCGKDYLSKIQKRLDSILGKDDLSKDEGMELFLLRKAISGLLHVVVLWLQPNTKLDLTEILIELFDSEKLKDFCIFGKVFPPINFSRVRVIRGWIDGFKNFDKCDFPSNSTVFFYTKFKNVSSKFGLVGNENLFDDATCSLNDELGSAYKDGVSSARNLYGQVKGNFRKVLKVGYSGGTFRWKTVELHMRKCSSLQGHVSLDSYINFLVSERILEIESGRAGRNEGYVVAKNYWVSVRQLIEEEPDSEIKLKISKFLKKFHNVEIKSFVSA